MYASPRYPIALRWSGLRSTAISSCLIASGYRRALRQERPKLTRAAGSTGLSSTTRCQTSAASSNRLSLWYACPSSPSTLPSLGRNSRARSREARAPSASPRPSRSDPRRRWKRNSSSSPSTSSSPPRIRSPPRLVGLVERVDLADVLARLRDVRHVPARAPHRLRPGVVGREHPDHVSAVLVRQDAQVAGAAVDVLLGIEGVDDVHLPGGAGHELHEPRRSL